MTKRMYDETKTWNPFKGCRFDCVYCEPSFKRQAKRQKHNCTDCYNYVPHYHPERLSNIPPLRTIFVCGNSDLSFCRERFMFQIIKAINKRNKRHPEKTYFFQSKRPGYFAPFLSDLPTNAIILTTLETNRDKGYRQISKAPVPTVRYKQLLSLDYPRKVVTIEPVLDFDLEVFVDWIKSINPEYVWLGYNSRPKQVQMPEPDEEKMVRFIIELKKNNIHIKFKELRNLNDKIQRSKELLELL
jgi:hypothetical protein